MRRLGVLAALVVAQGAWAGNYDTKVQQMRDLVSANKTIAQMETLGVNDQGQNIWGMKVSFPSKNLNKVRHLVVGTHHGNETHAAPTAMEFAEQIINVMKDANHTFHSEYKNMEIYIFPVLNVTGYDRTRRTENNGKTWLDPNRDYPDPCVAKTSFKLKSTKAIADFLEAKKVVGAVTIHGYIGTFTFPWGIFTKHSHSADHDDFMKWTKFATEVNRYRVGTHKDVIYPTAGAFEDYAYHELGVWATLLEIKRGADERKDAESLVRYFSQIPRQRSEDHRHDKKNCERNISRGDLERSRP